MTEQQLLDHLRQRTATNPAYTQPIRVPKLQSNLSPFHQRCRHLSWCVYALALGAILQFALVQFLPVTTKETLHEQRL